MLMPKTSSLPSYTVTVRDPLGKETRWGLRASDLETAAERAAKRVALDKRRVRAKRTSGKPGEPGWFFPLREGAAWPFAGNAFHIEVTP
jgi:hypothetical protein